MACPKREYGGTIVNIVIALIFFGLLGYGIMWLMKGYGQAGEQYAGAMVQAKLDATSVTCQMNMRAIGRTCTCMLSATGHTRRHWKN